ncbi:MAG: 30S ribosomal protein S13 [Candidatus Aerophobetes bacterium]|nr:30S ribosomal protein S13 [Candidatus Aerophobetes bacterium]
MARIAGVELPSNKKVGVGLTAIYGIGPSLVKQILSVSNISSDTRVKDLTEEEISKLHKIIESNYTIEGDLRRKVSSHINRLISIKSYRGVRHKTGLPVRGQRTRCNARTRKGPRKVLGSKKKR